MQPQQKKYLSVQANGIEGVGNTRNPSWVEIVHYKIQRRGDAKGTIIQCPTSVSSGSEVKLLQKYQPSNKAVVLVRKCNSATYTSITKQTGALINIIDLQVKIFRTLSQRGEK